MPVYTACAYECAYKDIGKRLIEDLKIAGIPCFYAGDIPDKERFDLLSAMAHANKASEVFIPFLCRDFGGSKFGKSELGIAISDEKLVIPVILDPDYGRVKPGGLLTGMRISDISSAAKYDAELPEIVRAIRAVIPAANGDSSEATGPARGNQDA